MEFRIGARRDPVLPIRIKKITYKYCNFKFYISISVVGISSNNLVFYNILTITRSRSMTAFFIQAYSLQLKRVQRRFLNLLGLS